MISQNEQRIDWYGRLHRPRLTGRRARIVTTGGRGFIGSHFVQFCLDRGHTVVDVDKLTYAAHCCLPFDGHPDYELIEADIAKPLALPDDVDVIVNFAAESHVDNSIADSTPFYRSNVRGVVQLLETVHQAAVAGRRPPLFCQISTDEVFGDRPPEGGFRPGDGFRPSNPYAASKVSAEASVMGYGRTYRIPYIITRSTNNYGPAQHEEKLIPCAISRLLEGRCIPIHGGGRYRRNWIHVRDNVEAIYRIIDRGETTRAYHIGTDEEYSVEEVVRMICDHMNRDYLESIDLSSDRPGADTCYALNCTATRKLGWEPRRHLYESLPAIIAYYHDRASIEMPEGAVASARLFEAESLVGSPPASPATRQPLPPAGLGVGR